MEQESTVLLQLQILFYFFHIIDFNIFMLMIYSFLGFTSLDTESCNFKFGYSFAVSSVFTFLNLNFSSIKLAVNLLTLKAELCLTTSGQGNDML